MRQIFLFLVFLTAHVVRIPFDPNPHHDGLMYTAAVASSRGLVPHRDFFSQYGPLTSLIHGLWFNVAPNTILSLRFFNAVLLSTTSFLLYQIIKKKIGSTISVLIVSIWSISSPEILPAGLPWPSVVSTLILMLAIYTVDNSKSTFNQIAIICAGVITSLAFFIRVHNLVIPILLTLLCLRSKQYGLLKRFFIGYLCGTTTVLGLLALHSALLPFIQQSIVWPLLGHAGSTYGPKVLVINVLLLLQFPFFAFILWLINLNRFNKIFALVLLTTCLIATYEYSRRIPAIPVSERSFLNFHYLSAFVAQQTLQMMAYGLMAVSLMYQFKFIRERLFSSQNSLLVSSISIGAIFQLYPSPDTYHVWWLTPLLIAGLPNSCKLAFNQFAKSTILMALLIVNFYHVTQIISIDRSHYESAVLSGMYGNEREVDQALTAIQNFLPTRSAHFNCVDGIFAANTKGYLANDVLYVNWPRNVHNPRIGSANFIVECGPQQPQNIQHYTLEWSNELISIYKINQD